MQRALNLLHRTHNGRSRLHFSCEGRYDQQQCSGSGHGIMLSFPPFDPDIVGKRSQIFQPMRQWFRRSLFGDQTRQLTDCFPPFNNWFVQVGVYLKEGFTGTHNPLFETLVGTGTCWIEWCVQAQGTMRWSQVDGVDGGMLT